MNWTVWQKFVSPLLSPLAQALANMPGQTVTLVAEEEVPQDRRAMGWRTPDCSPARMVMQPSSAEIKRIIERDEGQSVHLLNGWADVALNRRILPRLARAGATVGLVSESADSRGILGLARRFKYRIDRKAVERSLDFILAMGQLGVKWFETAGYDSSRIFPFGYVPAKPELTPKIGGEGDEGQPFRILFLGQIVRRKGGVTAIRALSGLSGLNWRFDVVGNGTDLGRWKRMAAACGVGDRIRFHPAVDNRSIGKLFQSADLFLLPSRWDGWGAVVNEALLCGVPAVCSSKCGAADLLREPWRGSTFEMGSEESLRGVLKGWIEQGKREDKATMRIRSWSAALEGPQVARYLIEVVKYAQVGGQRPSPPWY